MNTYFTISSIWLGFFSAFLFSTPALPRYFSSLGQKSYLITLKVLTVGFALSAIFFGTIASVISRVILNNLGIEYTGVDDPIVTAMRYSIVIFLGITGGVVYGVMKDATSKVELNIGKKKYFVLGGLLMAFLSAVSATLSNLL